MKQCFTSNITSLGEDDGDDDGEGRQVITVV